MRMQEVPGARKVGNASAGRSMRSSRFGTDMASRMSVGSARVGSMGVRAKPLLATLLASTAAATLLHS
jgi:hypothetical protein